jgi:hypothetical protein
MINDGGNYPLENGDTTMNPKLITLNSLAEYLNRITKQFDARNVIAAGDKVNSLKARIFDELAHTGAINTEKTNYSIEYSKDSILTDLDGAIEYLKKNIEMLESAKKAAQEL